MPYTNGVWASTTARSPMKQMQKQPGLTLKVLTSGEMTSLETWLKRSKVRPTSRKRRWKALFRLVQMPLKTSIDVGDLTPEKMAAFQQAQSGLTGALSKLMVVVERYPELKANQNFLELQSQLEGTENRINVERNRFNEKVNIYDIHTTKFPNKILAGWFGF